MKQPDWSKAPEGATHYDSCFGYWCNAQGWWDADGEWTEEDEQLGWGTERYIPRPYTTEGLPEVGDIVEYCDAGYPDRGYTSGRWKDGDKLEVIGFQDGESGDPVIILWNIDHKTADSLIPEYVRPIPRTITIGDMEVPEPVREPLEDGQEYFMIKPECAKYLDGVGHYEWEGSDIDLCRLRAGLIHATEENCAANFKALIKASGGEVE